MKTFKVILTFLIGGITASAQGNLGAYIDNAANNKFVEIANATNQISTPVDLDFHLDVINRPFELWVNNKGTSNSGGNTVIISDADTDTPSHKYVRDGNAWHFMALSSGIAFGDNGNFATSQDIIDANRNGGKFTGPTLWPSDLSIYGIVGNPPTSQYNGSHLDMIHQSPYGKGIAWESDNVFWIMDGYDLTVKRYNFHGDHGPGQTYHGDGEVRVYKDVSFKKSLTATVPSHCVIDDNKQWLYGCSTGDNKIFRLDITTGLYNKNLTKINNEPLAEYSEFLNATVEEVITTGLDKPVGIDIVGNQLIVTNNGSGELIIYDIDDDFAEMGRITPDYANADLMGVKIGPDGQIYFVDYSNKKVVRIENDQSFPVSTDEILNEATVKIYPNPSNSVMNFDFLETPRSIEILNLNGKLIQSLDLELRTQVDVSDLNAGIYLIKISFEDKVIHRKISVTKS
jgi:hypothetical protein|tara:strand:- start:3699 stop:5069 length:1371 start_codon:yes stop_codon:yes gene_type:complete